MTKKKLPCGRPLPDLPKLTPDAKSTLADLLLKLRAFVDLKKLNNSDIREKILKTIVFESRHFTAPDLLLRLKKRYPDIGKATLYRTLPVFVECGILQEGPPEAHGQTLYELTEDDHHDHIVCSDCQYIFEFHDEAIEKRQELVTEKNKFALTKHRHVIYATCEYLSKKFKKDLNV